MTVRAWMGLMLVAAATGCQSKAQLPELGKAPDFALVNQSGKPATQADLRGTPWVAAFLFTRCPTVCPRIMKRMRALQVQAADDDLHVRWVSFSVDPENDTPAVLTAFAKKYQANLKNWTFLTGDPQQIEAAAAGFKLALEGTVDASAEHYGITHGSHLVLVDAKGTIRGYYRSSDDEKMRELLRDIDRLD